MNDRIENQVNIDNIIYKINHNKEAIIIDNLLDQIIDLEIEQTIKHNGTEYTVVGLEVDCFKECKFLDSIVLPNTIRKVCRNAFEGSSVKHVFFGQYQSKNEVVFEFGVFQNAIRLETCRLPAGLIDIPDFTFDGALSLKGVEISWRTKRLGNMAFFNTGLTYFDYPMGLIQIGESCFQSSKLYYAEIGENVKSVGHLAFADIDTLQTMVIVNSKALFGDYFMKNNQKVTTYIKGDDNHKLVQKIKKDMGEHHHFVVDNFIPYEEDGLKYLLFSKNIARLVGYSERDIRPHTVILDRIGTAAVVDYGPGCLKYSKRLLSVTYPKSILRVKGKVTEFCPNLEDSIFKHNITREEARWVTSNDKAGITIIGKDIQKTYEARIECITITDEGLPLQKSFIEIFIGNNENEVLEEVVAYCQFLSIDSNKYKMLGIHEKFRGE